MAQKDKEVKHVINVIGDIDFELIDDFIKEIQYIKNEKTINTVELNIHSNGGFLHTCFAMIDLIEDLRKRRKINVKTYGYGAIVSAGFLLFLLGDTRKIMPNCRVYVHEHINAIDNQPFTKMKETFDEDYVLNGMYLKYVSSRTGISKEDASTLLKKDSWLSKEDIKKFKITSEGRNES